MTLNTVVLFDKPIYGLAEFVEQCGNNYPYESVAWLFEGETEHNLVIMESVYHGTPEGKDSWKPTQKSKRNASKIAEERQFGVKIGNIHSHCSRTESAAERCMLPSTGFGSDLFWAKRLKERVVGIVTVVKRVPTRLIITDINCEVLLDVKLQ